MTPATIPHRILEDENDFIDLLFSPPSMVEETLQQTSCHDSNYTEIPPNSVVEETLQQTLSQGCNYSDVPPCAAAEEETLQQTSSQGCNYSDVPPCSAAEEETLQQTSSHSCNSNEISPYSASITEPQERALRNTQSNLNCKISLTIPVLEPTEPCLVEIEISVQYNSISQEAKSYSETTTKSTDSFDLQQSSSKKARTCSADNNTSATHATDDSAESPILIRLEDSGTHNEHMSYSRDMSMYLDYHDSYTMEAKPEPNQKLLHDIKKINNRLSNIVLEVESASSSVFGAMNKTVVRCSYNPIVFSNDIMQQFASMIPPGAIAIEFLVPSEYPDSPPQILDRQPVGLSKEVEEMLLEAKYRFYSFSEGLEKLKELAGAWDHCAWSTLYDYAHQQTEQGLTIEEQISTLATNEHCTELIIP